MLRYDENGSKFVEIHVRLQDQVPSHGRGCPEGEEAPQGAETAVCSHPQVMLNFSTVMYVAGKGVSQLAL